MGKRLVNQPLPNERAFIGRPAVLVAAAIVVGRSAVHPRGLLAGRSLLNGAGVHFGRQSDGSGSDDEGGDEGLGKHMSVLGAWAAEVRYQAACRRNIPQGAMIEREALHTQEFIDLAALASEGWGSAVGGASDPEIQRSLNL